MIENLQRATASPGPHALEDQLLAEMPELVRFHRHLIGARAQGVAQALGWTGREKREILELLEKLLREGRDFFFASPLSAKSSCNRTHRLPYAEASLLRGTNGKGRTAWRPSRRR